MHGKENIKVKKKPVILWEFWMDPFDNIDKMNLANETEEEELENLYSGAYEEKEQQMEEAVSQIVDIIMGEDKPVEKEDVKGIYHDLSYDYPQEFEDDSEGDTSHC